MSMPFANPWSNPNNPIDMLKRRRRKKAKAAAKQDHRDTEVADNRAYESNTQNTAAAYQRNQSRRQWNDPFADARSSTTPVFSDAPRPSANYDPFDW